MEDKKFEGTLYPAGVYCSIVALDSVVHSIITMYDGGLDCIQSLHTVSGSIIMQHTRELEAGKTLISNWNTASKRQNLLMTVRKFLV